MGWSASALALNSLDALLDILQKENGNDSKGGSNTWIHDGDTHFYETGREQVADGAITGSVRRCSKKWNLPTDAPDVVRAKKVGSLRIEPNGDVSRFPTATAKQRKRATEEGRKKFEEVYGVDMLERQLDICRQRWEETHTVDIHRV